ncbi:MAG TPA: ATP-binding protein, partial [Deltaproteobacteria bacterium]|nr:ATP-binding protein [Deltaproteobacteria bacterium]
IEGKTGAVIRTSIPFENIDILLATLRQDIMKMSFIIIAASLFIAFFISHRISSPIRELNRASRQVAGGDLDVRVTLKSNDEMRELAANFNDMTEHLQTSFTELNSRKEELESIITSITEALLVIDTRGKILMFNESAKRIAGSEKILGRYFWEVIRSVKLNAIVEQADKRPVSDDFEMEESFYLCSVTPIRSGRAKVVLLHDITEMKRIEEIKKDLVVNVSHELRTPLTAIKGFTETLMDEAGDETREYVEIIQRHTDRLIHIVNDILDLSELEERGMKLNLEKVNLQDLIEKVLVLFSQRIEEKGLEIRSEWPSKTIVIDADPFRLEQLFSNLIDNALKYTDHGFIILDLKDSPDEIIIRVSDTGAGIPREHLQRIFERFYVVDKSRSRILGGTGLGLSIVKHIVSLHKGTITAQSKLNIGTTFTITLPKDVSSEHESVAVS